MSPSTSRNTALATTADIAPLAVNMARGDSSSSGASSCCRPLRLRNRRAIGGGQRSRNGVGFALIELLSVVAIIGVLAAIAIPRNREIVERARVAKAIGDLRTLAIDIYSADPLPSSLATINRNTLLDPWGRPYVYLLFPVGRRGVPGGARKDRFLVPINSQFDLYSLGKDGVSSPPLTSRRSRDDVIMANDGGYYGLASKY